MYRRGSGSSDLPRNGGSLIDKLVGKAGTAGRDATTIEDIKGSRGRLPDDLTREKMASGSTAGLLHLTISQDQTSSSQFSRENLAALSKPLDEVGIALIDLVSTQNRSILKTFRTIAKRLDHQQR